MTAPTPSIPSAAPASAERLRPAPPDRLDGRAFSPILSQAQLHDDHRAVPVAERPRPANPGRASRNIAEPERQHNRSGVDGGRRSDATEPDRRRPVDRGDRQRDSRDGSSDRPERSRLATDDSVRPERRIDGSSRRTDTTGDDGPISDLDRPDGDNEVTELQHAGTDAELDLAIDGESALDGEGDVGEPPTNSDHDTAATDWSAPSALPSTTAQPVDGATPAEPPPTTDGQPSTEPVASDEPQLTELDASTEQAAPSVEASGGSASSAEGAAAVGQGDEATTTDPEPVDGAAGDEATPAIDTPTGETNPRSSETAERSDQSGRHEGEAPATTTTGSDPSALDRAQDTAATASTAPEPSLASSIETTGSAPHRATADPSAPAQPSGIATAAIDGQANAAIDGSPARVDVGVGSVGSRAEALDGEAANELWGQVQRALHRIRTGPEGTELRLRLHPAELGELLIQVRAQGEQLSVRLITSSAAAHQTLVADQQRLAAELSEAGFTDGTVDVGEWGTGSSGDGRSSGRDQAPTPGSDPSLPARSRSTPTTVDRATTDPVPAVAGPRDGRPVGSLVDLVL